MNPVIEVRQTDDGLFDVSYGGVDFSRSLDMNKAMNLIDLIMVYMDNRDSKREHYEPFFASNPEWVDVKYPEHTGRYSARHVTIPWRPQYARTLEELVAAMENMNEIVDFIKQAESSLQSEEHNERTLS